jgi:glycosyltransferase involved in cell wall biosynthesis
MEKVSTNYDVNKICFIGNMRTLQNQDAVLFFVGEVFPLIKREMPKAQFYIVGAEPPQRILSLASDDVVVTGFVDDLEATLSDACLAVAPVRIAAGIQNKVLVAMGCGLPVVMTSLISRAIPELKDGENCVIRDEAASMAEQCVCLMKQRNLRQMIGKNGYEVVLQHYSWEEKLKGYELL